MKDADKLKLMLLAWNYQNTSAAGKREREIEGEKEGAFSVV